MITKTFEIRDKATFIPVLAIKLIPECEPDRYLISRAGYGRTVEQQSEYVLLVRFDGGDGKACCDPFEWGGQGRTMQVAHEYLVKNFDTLNSGEVICVETILGERATPKVSERLEEQYHGSV